MRTLITVFIKEVIDNVRDRRTLASALIMGPLFGPMLFAFVINLSIERSLDDVDRSIELPVIGAERAPNLMRYLRSHNIEIVTGPADREAAVVAVTAGELDVIVVVSDAFAEQLADTIPAKIELLSDLANTQAERDARRVRGALNSYGQELATLRLMARGVNPMTLRPISVDEIDVSTPSGRSAILLGMMSYFFIFALLMGGMYRHDRGRARARLARTAAVVARDPRQANAWEDRRDLCLYGGLAAAQSLLVLCCTQVHAARTARHDAELRPRCRPRRIPGVAAIHGPRRRADDSRCIVYEKL